MSLKRKIDQAEYFDFELTTHFSKKLCLRENEITNLDGNGNEDKTYLINVIREQTIESLSIIQNDMGSKDFLKIVYNRYLNILDKFEINNSDITLEIINFFRLYMSWIDTNSTNREIMCKLFSIILSLDTYFINNFCYYVTI
jgi:hypothetical protein